LSFFLWGQPPDKELIAAAQRKELSTMVGLDKQARRLLADPRSSALADRFAAQWLRLQDVEKVRPDPNFYPNFDENLAAAMRRETVLFFNSLVQDDRSFLDEASELLPPEPWDETTWSAWTNALKAKSGRKGRALFHPLRLALTGREDGPELKSLLPLLGRKACQARLS